MPDRRNTRITPSPMTRFGWPELEMEIEHRRIHRGTPGVNGRRERRVLMHLSATAGCDLTDRNHWTTDARLCASSLVRRTPRISPRKR
jgi:hypothetical protein